MKYEDNNAIGKAKIVRIVRIGRGINNTVIAPKKAAKHVSIPTIKPNLINAMTIQINVKAPVKNPQVLITLEYLG